jgi:hypothetical protein
MSIILLCFAENIISSKDDRDDRMYSPSPIHNSPIPVANDPRVEPSRPKRQRKIPSHLQDYVIWLSSNRSVDTAESSFRLKILRSSASYYPTSYFAHVKRKTLNAFFGHSRSFAHPKTYIQNDRRDEIYNPVPFVF